MLFHLCDIFDEKHQVHKVSLPVHNECNLRTLNEEQ